MNEQIRPSVEENMDLVYFLIRLYYPTYIYDEDIVQCGMVGLCKAAETWNEDKGTFSTYASKCIRNHIRKEFQYRNRHSNMLSLDYEFKDNDGESTTLSEILVGYDDVEFVDFGTFYEQLTPSQKEVFDLTSIGMSPKQISEHLGKAETTIHTHIRRIKALWREVNGS